MTERLLSLIQNLQKRVEKLEKDNKDLKKWAYREKKKINVILSFAFSIFDMIINFRLNLFFNKFSQILNIIIT